MDFYQIKEREGKKASLEVYPDFKVVRSKDLMIRGRSFYGIWDEEKGLWSTDEFDVQRLIDEDLAKYESTTTGIYEIHRKFLANYSSSSWLQFRNYISSLPDNFHQLDDSITFKNTPVIKEDYISRRLPYDLVEGDISAWDEIVGTLYSEEDRAKIEWAIGAIISGDSKTIQKFLVFYGAQGSGKSTILNIVQWMFEGYFTSFVAKELTGANNSFALESFKANPLVAIEHDGDLSRIQDNSKLNSLVSHEWMSINEKNKPIYMARFNAMLMIGSNSAVKFTDSKSGLVRRLIDIHPSGNLIPPRKYQTLMNQVRFELGAVAQHCLNVYQGMGKDYYSGYRPIEMMLQTDVFFNFVEYGYDVFEKQNGTTLNQAYEMYKLFLEDSGIDNKLPKYKFRDELKSYFDKFEDRGLDEDGERIRSVFTGFKADKFKTTTGKTVEHHMYRLVMDEKDSLFDKTHADCKAQYANSFGTPIKPWDEVTTTLKDLDTSKLHFVQIPENEIVIDFDLRNAEGEKDAERNLEVASTWPATYAEFSKSGGGIHLHYNYTGDPSELRPIFDDGIEVKVYTGNSSLRRMLSACNSVPISEMNPGALPVKEKKVIDEKKIADEKHLRALINKALRKEVHPGTKSNVDYIHHILEEAYASGQTYNVSDMKKNIMAFAAKSSHQSLTALKLVQNMKFASEDSIEAIESGETAVSFKSKATMDADRLVVFDVEVFPNLFVVCWKYQGAPKESIVKMINPTVQDIEKLMTMKLVGFNVRKYDNHILYGAYQGYDNLKLYKLSKSIIDKVPDAFFGQAYNISYTDIYDFSSKKQSLKKWEIELGIHHMELGLPWDEPVPEELWDKVVEYCANDVEATDIVLDHLQGDFIARQILSEISGLSMNATTNQHTKAIIFGQEQNPQREFKYTNLADLFPGYTHGLKTKNVAGKDVYSYESTYRDEVTGEGGYVYAEPGIYTNVAVLDVASMHPSSIIALDAFGSYTENFHKLLKIRVAIKRKKFDEARELLGPKLARLLDDPGKAKALSNALKIAINAVYGLTSASFDNAFKDPRNIDNIVAKRGALFMIELKHAVQEQGFQVVHIKTDSIKIPNATPEIIQFVFDFGAKYQYEFEHEETFEKFCLVNDAVYIAKIGWHATEPEKVGTWEATGAQFQQPYVYKTLFSREEITFKDMQEAKSVQAGVIYLDYTGLDDTPAEVSEGNQRIFIGKTGLFTPMKHGGGVLLRVNDDKEYAVTGTKGYLWMESEQVAKLNKQKDIDKTFYMNQVEAAIEQIKKYGDYEWFVGQ